MKYSEFLNCLLLKLENTHPNLYHDVSKKDILNYINSIKNLESLSTEAFDLVLCKLFHLFYDAHTSFYPPFYNLSYKLNFIDGKFYILIDNNLEEISKFGQFDCKTFYQLLKSILNYETIEWLNFKIKSILNNQYIYKMLGLSCNDCIDLTLRNGKTVLVRREPLDANRQKIEDKNNFYNYEILDNGILYLRYKKCKENENNPFPLFVKEIKNRIEKENITKFILDVRQNTGGNSEILNPFENLVKKKKLKGCVLIDNGVFSSGRIAVARFKREFDCILVGQPTGGAVCSYGNCKYFEIEGRTFSVSTTYYDYSKVFGYNGAIKPDVFVKNTIEDTMAKCDKIKDKAIKILSQM